jgi:hypothetical protein
MIAPLNDRPAERDLRTSPSGFEERPAKWALRQETSNLIANRFCLERSGP